MEKKEQLGLKQREILEARHQEAELEMDQETRNLEENKAELEQLDQERSQIAQKLE